jgi:hypothetical protein
MKVMAELGNNIVNKILEGRIPSPSATAAAGGEALRKPGPESSRPEREAWIFAKYRDRRFVDRDIFQAEEFRHSEAWTVKRLRRRARSQHHQHRQQQRKAGLRIRIQSGQWIRIRDRNPDPDPGGKNDVTKVEKNKEIQEIHIF